MFVKFQKSTCVSSILTVLLLLFSTVNNSIAQTMVNINGKGAGRTFEGEGVLSGGGGNTKLLKDYDEPYRSQILDYLFKPNFGASYQELKVEIGGDINSTSGTEPSHARTAEEVANPVMTRGYETWLIDQAKKRNPKITLYGLEWGAPGWIGNIWSQSNADYLVSYIKGLKRVWGYDIDFIGGNQNELFNGTSKQVRDYIVNILRPTLNKNGLSKVKIVAPDILSSDWKFANQLSGDTALKNAIAVVGYHYVKTETTTAAKNCGLPIWESEGWTGIGDWKGAYALAKEMNLNYINGKMTKTDVWHLINSQYDNANWAHSGIMEANTPWSGHYVVSPAVWAAAHTNQFAQPGWKYLDSGCGVTTKGTSYVTFKNPLDKNYSIVIVVNDSLNESITFNLTGGLATTAVHVWKSTSSDQFIQQKDITVSAGKFTIHLEAGAIYSLTTTSGQHKGNAGAIPATGSFTNNYSENFESYGVGATPNYLYDIFGAFDVESLGTNKVLRQVITGPNLEWNAWGNYPPTSAFTEFGDLNWQNYDYSADVRIESTGTACIYGRVGHAFPSGGNVCDYNGYRLSIHDNGNWTLCYGSPSSIGTRKDEVLSSGTISGFSATNWHNLKLSFNGSTIKAYIDNKQMDSVINTEKCSGMAGLGSGWNNAQFDNLAVTVGAGINDSIVSGGTYSIANHNSGKVLSPLGASTISGANIVQVTDSGTTAQQWIFTDLGTGYWTIKNVASGLVMDINEASTSDGANNIQKASNNAFNQQWKISPVGCYYTIINRNSGKLLDISRASKSTNAQGVQWISNGANNQQWKLTLLKSPI